MIAMKEMMKKSGANRDARQKDENYKVSSVEFHYNVKLSSCRGTGQSK